MTASDVPSPLPHPAPGAPPAPRVSIGLPVYNGEAYLAEAIASILGQTFGDLELVISDNASSDRTEEICRRFMAADPRVRYHRNERNLGSAANWNRVLELARGEYFKWAADDDVLRPTYLEKCIAVLDAAADVVLCHSRTQVLRDGHEAPMRELQGLDRARPSARFAAVILRPHWTLEAHGVMRTAALRRAEPMKPYWGSDKAVLAELALMGRIARVEEPLFLNRDHPGRTMRAYSFTERLWFHFPDKARRILPQWALYKDYRAAVRRQVRARDERRRCHAVLAQWWLVNWNLLRVGLDLAAAGAPGLARLAFRARERYHRRGIGVREG
jgi:glycosyltransferase involved in cell wall biosynthesis